MDSIKLSEFSSHIRQSKPGFDTTYMFVVRVIVQPTQSAVNTIFSKPNIVSFFPEFLVSYRVEPPPPKNTGGGPGGGPVGGGGGSGGCG